MLDVHKKQVRREACLTLQLLFSLMLLDSLQRRDDWRSRTRERTLATGIPIVENQIRENAR